MAKKNDGQVGSTDKIEFSSTLSKGDQNNSNHDVKGYITKEAIYLENQLISNLS